MGSSISRELSPLDFAKQACDTMIKRFPSESLPPVGKFYYHQGVFLSGMQKTYELCKEDKYFNYVKSWVDSVIQEDGSIHYMDKGQLDYLQPGVLLYQLYNISKDERYKKALDTLISIIDDFPKSPEGGFWHNEHCQDQMWLDGLYMAGPICTQYAAAFKKMKYFDLAAYQALLMEQKTKDTTTGLWYHACDRSKKSPWANPTTGNSPEFWGRSIGWVPVAILEELDHIPKEHKDKDELIRLTTDLLKAVIKYQDSESGLWYQVIDKGDQEDNWLESSCTCLFVAAICKAVRNNYLDDTYLDIAQKGYKGIINRLRYDGDDIIVDNICIGTGVGDYAHYCARPTSKNDLHGMGAFLIMCTEAERIL